ncbi:MAG: PilZ domain-containing protein [Candidatus Omnitrophica bacterium]|nr:PilZ domain-containing protein [Candidatus Omnitrophota bacterium]
MKWDGPERRKYVRIKFPCKIFIFTPTQHIISTHTENISMGGIKLAIEEKLKISSLIDLEIYVYDETIVCKGKVTWGTKKESRCHKGVYYYDIGVDFHDISDKDKKIIRRLIESED